MTFFERQVNLMLDKCYNKETQTLNLLDLVKSALSLGVAGAYDNTLRQDILNYLDDTREN